MPKPQITFFLKMQIIETWRAKELENFSRKLFNNNGPLNEHYVFWHILEEQCVAIQNSFKSEWFIDKMLSKLVFCEAWKAWVWNYYAFRVFPLATPIHIACLVGQRAHSVRTALLPSVWRHQIFVLYGSPSCIDWKQSWIFFRLLSKQLWYGVSFCGQVRRNCSATRFPRKKIVKNLEINGNSQGNPVKNDAAPSLLST